MKLVQGSPFKASPLPASPLQGCSLKGNPLAAISRSLVTVVASVFSPGPSAVRTRPEPTGHLTDHLQDVIFFYSGFFGCASKCRLRWITSGDHAGGDNASGDHARGQHTIIIATQLPDNRGTSITNMAEDLATLVCARYHFDPARIIWIEHYPDRCMMTRQPDGRMVDPLYKECFNHVTFHRDGATFSCPQWTHMTKQQVEALVGQALVDGQAW